jgi:hypothetical protein
MLDWVLFAFLFPFMGFLWWRIARLEKHLERQSNRLRAIHDDTGLQHRALEVRLDRVLEYIESGVGRDKAA